MNLNIYRKFSRKELKKKKCNKNNLLCKLDWTNSVEDGFIDLADFTKFLKDCIKVDKKVNSPGSAVTIKGAKNQILVNTNINFSKRYLKYLNKKYLKKFNLLDWLRVVSSAKEI